MLIVRAIVHVAVVLGMKSGKTDCRGLPQRNIVDAFFTHRCMVAELNGCVGRSGILVRGGSPECPHVVRMERVSSPDLHSVGQRILEGRDDPFRCEDPLCAALANMRMGMKQH